MIAQVLNREFVLDQVCAVLAELSTPADQRARGGLPFDISARTLEATADLTQALQREQSHSSGQKGFDDDTESRRGQEAALIDDTVFFSHDALISNLQSALTEYFEDRCPEKLVSVSQTDDLRRSAGSSTVAEYQLIGCEPLPREGDRRLFNKFSETDPGWVASLFAMGVRLLRDKRAFNVRPAEPLRIANNARLILVGDWGTGLPRAVEVGKQMRQVVEQGKKAGLEQHVIHLGDVYYSGWEREYRQYFLPHWPVNVDEANDRLYSWCLNGNHDMYSGGYAYFDYLLADPRFARQQSSSFFSLHNDYWNILGLDTAYDEAGLRDLQLEWISRTTAGAPRRSMLLSHHQLFSAYDAPSAPLQIKIGEYLKKNAIDVWFWGHEHRCVFYRDHQGVRNARLIGNGGVPVYMTHSKNAEHATPSFFEYRQFISSGFEKWAYLGFAVVDFADSVARVRYIDEFGSTLIEGCVAIGEEGSIRYLSRHENARKRIGVGSSATDRWSAAARRSKSS